MSYQDHLEVTPGKRGGKPCIKGTRISVYDVLAWLASGITQQEVIDDYPELTLADIQACLDFDDENKSHSKRVPGLHVGAFQMRDDFNDPIDESDFGTLNNFVGLLEGRTTKLASIEEINEAAANGWAGKI